VDYTESDYTESLRSKVEYTGVDYTESDYTESLRSKVEYTKSQWRTEVEIAKILRLNWTGLHKNEGKTDSSICLEYLHKYFN
jgi:hypothetical protein